MSVKAIKLKSGDELIGEISDDMERITNPIGLMHGNQGKMQMVPWFPISKERTFDLEALGVVALCDVIDELENSYNEMYSVIVKPDTNIKLIKG